MAKVSIVKGTTSYLARVFIQDSSKTDGSGLTLLAYNTSGLVCYRARDDDGNAGGTAMTLATATRGTWTSIGFVEKDATNLPGVYEFGVPNAALATGSKSVLIMFRGATNMAPCVLEIELTANDNQDSVRAGLTALPNAAAEAAGGLYTRGTGAGQINQDANGRIDANTKAWIGGAIPAVNVTGVPLVDDKYLLGTVYSTPATAGIMDINVKNMNNVAATPITTIKAVQGLTTADTIATYTGNTKQTGDVYAALPANFSAFVIDATGRVNAFLIGILTTVFTEGAAGRIAAAFKQFFNIASPAATMDHGILVDTVTTATTASALTTNNDKTGYGLSATAIQAIWDALTSALTTVGSIGKRISDFLTGDAYVRLGAPAGASVSADVAAVKAVDDAVKAKTDNLPAAPASTTNITGGMITTVTNLTNAPTSGDLTAAMKASVTTAATAATPTAAAVTGAVGSVTAGVTVTTNNDKTGYGLSATAITAIWAYVVEGTHTAVGYMRLFASALLAKLSGAATSTITIRDVDDTKARIVVTVDADGNRSAFGTRDET